MGTSRPEMLDMARTTTIIGELISLTTEREDLTTALGREGLAYYQAGLFYDESTLDLCRRLEGAVQQVEQARKDLEATVESDPRLRGAQTGALNRVRKSLFMGLMRREGSQLEKSLRDQYDELAARIAGLSSTDPRALSAKMLRMCGTLDRLKEDIDRHWQELESRTKAERKGPMFLLVLNMFLVNFFKFSNNEWFRQWIASFNGFQAKIGQRIHKDVVHDVESEDAAPAVEGASSGEGAPAADRASTSVPVPPPTPEATRAPAPSVPKPPQRREGFGGTSPTPDP